MVATDHHLGFREGSHFEPIFVNISVGVQDSIEGLEL